MSNTSATSPPATAVAVVDEARARVVELADTLWAARTPVELLATATALEKLRSTLDAVQLQVIAEIEATGAARAEGWSSTKDFCTAISGGRAGSGRATVALARAITTDRAATGRALAAGTISQTQAQVIVAAIDRLPVNPQLRAAAEAALLDDARTRDASELTRSGQYVLERLDPDGAQRRDEQALDREERSAHLGRYLSLADDGIGGVRLKGRGTVEDAAVIKKVLMSLGAPVTSDPGTCGGVPTDRIGACGSTDCAHDGKDAREHGTRMWDALVDACHQLASTDLLPESHGLRPQVTVTIRPPGLGRHSPRMRALGHGRAAVRSGGAAVRLRRRHPPGGAREQFTSPGRRPQIPAGHSRDVAGVGSPRPALRVSWVHSPTGRLRRSPRRALGGRRQHRAAQPGAAVPASLHLDSHHALGGADQPPRRTARVSPACAPRS